MLINTLNSVHFKMYTPCQSATRYNCRCPSWNDDPYIKERALQNYANDAAAADHEYSRRAATAGPILLWICCTTCSYSWQDFDWRNASHGPSAVAELLAFHLMLLINIRVQKSPMPLPPTTLKPRSHHMNWTDQMGTFTLQFANYTT